MLSILILDNEVMFCGLTQPKELECLSHNYLH